MTDFSTDTPGTGTPGAAVSPGDADRQWWGEPDPVEVFAAGLELALRQLRVEVVGLRAERDGLRLEVEGLRAKLLIAQQQLHAQQNLGDIVRQLQAAVARLTLDSAAAASEAGPSTAPTGSSVAPPASSPVVTPAHVVLPQWPEPDLAPIPTVGHAPVSAAAPQPPPASAPPATPPSAIDQLQAMGLWPPRPVGADAAFAPPDDTAFAPPADAASAPPPPAYAPPDDTASAPPPPAYGPPVDATAPPDAAFAPPDAAVAPPDDTDVAPPAADFAPPDDADVAPPAEYHTPAASKPVVRWDRGSTRRVPALLEDEIRHARPPEAAEQVAPRTRRYRLPLTIAAGVIGALVVLTVLLVSVGPRVLPYQTYFVRSGSMEPTIETGAMVVLTKTDGSRLGPGDIITFKNPNDESILVTHRIVEVETNEQGRVFVTKGDANTNPDPWRVPASGTGWKYAFDVPMIGYVFGFLGTPQARLALLVIPAAILGLLALLDIWRPKRASDA